MTYAITGSMAYDTILLHEGAFHQRILPEAIARLNVSFGIDSRKQEFGGTAGNIAYNAALLKDYPVIFSSVGNDFENYEKHCKDHGIRVDQLTYVGTEKTAHAWLITDENNNQITAFHAGAMKEAPDLPSFPTFQCMHIAPQEAQNMATAWTWCLKNQVPYFLDPGQALPSLIEKDRQQWDLMEALSYAHLVFVNDYEFELLTRHVGPPSNWLMESAFLIKTLGSKGCQVFDSQGEVGQWGVAQAQKITDPTGCGDAFRAGFINRWLKHKPLEECIALGATMGSFAIECSGGQNHRPSVVEIESRAGQFLKKEFNFNPKVQRQKPD